MRWQMNGCEYMKVINKRKWEWSLQYLTLFSENRAGKKLGLYRSWTHDLCRAPLTELTSQLGAGSVYYCQDHSCVCSSIPSSIIWYSYICIFSTHIFFILLMLFQICTGSVTFTLMFWWQEQNMQFHKLYTICRALEFSTP